ncbi:DDB1- and CUL4-associated factor 4 [Varanus komodoensis]|nr:DDB1- and CUL4-associated factor 4 [Varanus komodoensis]
MQVKEESTKVGLKLNIKKTKIMASGPLTSWQIEEEEIEGSDKSKTAEELPEFPYRTEADRVFLIYNRRAARYFDVWNRATNAAHYATFPTWHPQDVLDRISYNPPANTSSRIPGAPFFIPRTKLNFQETLRDPIPVERSACFYPLFKAKQRLTAQVPFSAVLPCGFAFSGELFFHKPKQEVIVYNFPSLSSSILCRLIHELKVNCMQRRKLEIGSPDSSVSGSNHFKLIAADTACERIFTLNDVEHGRCKYGIVNLSGLGKNSLTVEMYDNLYFTNRKLCLMGTAKTLGCACLLPASLFNNSNAEDQLGMLCSFKISTAWSCAWCLNPQADNCFSTGLSRRILVTNAVTGHRQTFNTSSDVLAQQFATQTPVLYNGCRSGEVFSIDIRQHSHRSQGWNAVRLFHDSAVTAINLLKTEQYLMVADMAGRIKLWDLRKLKCVKEYRGHHNEHTVLPLHISEEEGLLTAGARNVVMICFTLLPQWVKIVTQEFGVSKTLICYGLSLLHIHLPQIPSQAWSSHQGLEAPEGFLVCLWQSDRISIIFPIKQMIHIVSIPRTWIFLPCLAIENKNVIVSTDCYWIDMDCRCYLQHSGLQ